MRVRSCLRTMVQNNREQRQSGMKCICKATKDKGIIMLHYGSFMHLLVSKFKYTHLSCLDNALVWKSS